MRAPYVVGLAALLTMRACSTTPQKMSADGYEKRWPPNPFCTMHPMTWAVRDTGDSKAEILQFNRIYAEVCGAEGSAHGK